MRNSTQNNFWKSNILNFVLLIIFLGSISFFYKPVYGVLSFISKPVLVSSTGLQNALDDAFLYSKNKSELIAMIKVREMTIKEMEALSQKYDLVLDINKSLSDLLKNENQFKIEMKSKGFTSVISRPPFTPYDTIVLDIGADSQLKEGDLVLSANEYIGKVVAVRQNTAVAELVSSPNIITNVWVASSTFSMKGLGGGAMVIEVPKNFGVSRGQAVGLANVSEPVPVGSVERVSSADDQPFDLLYLSLSSSINSLRFVEIYEAPNL